jgi:hypothetical protein
MTLSPALQKLVAGKSIKHLHPPVLFIPDEHHLEITQQLACEIRDTFIGSDIEVCHEIVLTALGNAGVFRRSSEAVVKRKMIRETTSMMIDANFEELDDHIEEMRQILSA